jgi:aspartyl protease family protein
MKLCLILSCLTLSSLCFQVSAKTVTVKGLFSGAAILVIDGEQVLLKKGKSKYGVTLVEATSRDAILDINGKRQQVVISKQVGGDYETPTVKTVRIASRQGGHHWVQGRINDYAVDFIVDTGASLVSMNAVTAKRLGINYEKGEPGYMSTANGVTEVSRVILSEVTIGSITHYNIEASVGLDNSLPVTLLGNSFLSKVKMRVENGVMILESHQ